MIEWFRSEVQLPKEGTYVIARHSRGTWIDKDDTEGVNYVVVKLVKGLTMEERSQLPDDDRRKKEYHGADEFGNNMKGYHWRQFGPDNFFGQIITHWAYFNHIPLGERQNENHEFEKKYNTGLGGVR